MRGALREVLSQPRQHVASLLVVVLGAVFGVVMVGGIDTMAAWMETKSWVLTSETAQGLLGMTVPLFFGISLFVTGLVISTTFAIIVAGRHERIALLRLIGASASRLRASVTWEGLLVGGAGALLGTGIGIGLLAAGRAALADSEGADAVVAPLFTPALAVPALACIAVTVTAAHHGSRRVLEVTPLEAAGAAIEQGIDDAQANTGTWLLARFLLGSGAFLLLLGVIIGVGSPFGVVIALGGGILSFIGLVTGAPWILPPLQRAASRALGRSGAGRLAADNVERTPVRTSRTTMSLVIGVTLVVMLATGAENLRTAVTRNLAASGREADEIADISGAIDALVAVFWLLVAVSAVIAVIGLAASASLTVRQRHREIALLRAIGQPRRATRRMIIAESAQVTTVAVVLGIALGLLYGWAGSLAMLMSIPDVGFFLTRIPWAVLLACVFAGLAVVGVASLVPAALAARLSPTRALAAA